MLQGSRACVCPLLSRAKQRSITEDEDPSLPSPLSALHGHGTGIKAVRAGAGTEEILNAGRLSHGNGQENPQDISQGGNGNEKTQLRAAPLRRFPRGWGLVSSGPPGPQSAVPSILAAPPTLGTLEPAFPCSLLCYSEICFCSFSAAVPWTSGVWDAAAPGESCHPRGASEHGPCSSSCRSWRNRRQQANSRAKPPSETPTRGVSCSAHTPPPTHTCPGYGGCPGSGSRWCWFTWRPAGWLWGSLSVSAIRGVPLDQSRRQP